MKFVVIAILGLTTIGEMYAQEQCEVPPDRDCIAPILPLGGGEKCFCFTCNSGTDLEWVLCTSSEISSEAIQIKADRGEAIPLSLVQILVGSENDNDSFEDAGGNGVLNERLLKAETVGSEEGEDDTGGEGF